MLATVRFAAFRKCQNFGENQCLLNKIAKVILRMRVSQMKILFPFKIQTRNSRSNSQQRPKDTKCKQLLRVRGNISPVNLHISLSKLVARTKTVEAARADGEKIRLIGAAEARATEAVGRFSHPLSRLFKLQLKTFLRAEAERMRMKASAYKQYGDAAILSLVLEALPQIAAEVRQTLWNMDGASVMRCLFIRCLHLLPRPTRLC